MDNKILSLLSIARKAGRVEPGEEPSGSAARAKKARLLLLASDAAENISRRAEGFSATAGCPLVRLETDRAALGAAIGKDVCAVCAVTDMGLAAGLMERVAETRPEYSDAAAAMKEKAARMLARKKKKRG